MRGPDSENGQIISTLRTQERNARFTSTKMTLNAKLKPEQQQSLNSLIEQTLGLIFFNTWFTDFFLKILRSEEGKK